MVKPDRIDDIQAQVIARDVAKQVEEELTYPGQIRIVVTAGNAGIGGEDPASGEHGCGRESRREDRADLAEVRC
jgi:hypothetical protein